MKFLAFSDIHASEEALDRLRILLMKHDDYDRIFVVGDLTTNGPVSYADELLSLLKDKAIAVHGNMDPFSVEQLINQRGVGAHGKKLKLGEWNVVGLGGSNPTPFNTPCEYSEEKIDKLVSDAGLDQYSIFLSHPPPWGLFDVVGKGMHAGSVSVRKALDEKKPILCICGHIHEHEGKKLHGETTVVKLGAAEKLQAAEIKIGEEIRVTFFRI